MDRSNKIGVPPIFPPFYRNGAWRKIIACLLLYISVYAADLFCILVGMKPPLHKPCGTAHWSTQPCPLVKEVRTKALAAAMNQNKLVSDARVLLEEMAEHKIDAAVDQAVDEEAQRIMDGTSPPHRITAPMFPPSALRGPSKDFLERCPTKYPPDAFEEKPKRGRPRTISPEQRKAYLAQKAAERRQREKTKKCKTCDGTGRVPGGERGEIMEPCTACLIERKP